jgi:hypothetical protein
MTYFISQQDGLTIVGPDGAILAKATSPAAAALIVDALNGWPA